MASYRIETDRSRIGSNPGRRTPVLFAVLVLTGLVGACSCGESANSSAAGSFDSGVEKVETGARYRSDSRMQDLLAGCSQEYYYDRDTSYMIPVLIEKLQKGYTEPLQRAKNELATMGPVAMEQVRRLAEAWYTDQSGSSYVQNALDVAVISTEPLAREIVLRFLDHPRDTLRRLAVRGLTLNHVRPEDFDRLWYQLEAESAGLQEQLVSCLYEADSGRAEHLFLSWLEAETHAHLWKLITPLIASSTRPETVQNCIDTMRVARIDVRPFLAAAAARAGNRDALDLLKRELTDEGDLQRALVATAAAQAGLSELLLFSLVNDPTDEVRKIAASALIAMTPTTEIRDRLFEALGDPARGVRLLALEALVGRADPAATERALALLEGDVQTTQDGLFVLRSRMQTDPKLADRARSLLIARDEAQAHQTLKTRFKVLKVIGSVPGEESAKYLRGIALEQPGMLSTKRAHLMLTLQASNSGESGRAWLYSELESERDPQRRLDLLWAATCFRTDQSRTRLNEFLAQPDLSPYEVLFAADLLARLGPSQDVAPLLKRICYRVTQDDVRQGLRCLMWKWY